MPNRWRDILDSLRKSGSRELKEGVYQLCSYYQCTLFERSPLWYLVHNQMIQNKRSQLVRDINICCSAYGWCRHMLWSICLVCQVEQANPWGKTPTNISTSKKFAFTIFPDEMCKWRQIRFPPTSALVNLFWQVVVGWRENLLCKLFVTLCVHHANGASKDDEHRQVCHVLPGCHLRKELPFWRQYFTNRPVLPRGIDSMFCGNQLFSSTCVSPSRGKCLATSNWRHGSQN